MAEIPPPSDFSPQVPNRGQQLVELCDYVEVSPQEMRTGLIAEVEADPLAVQIATEMQRAYGFEFEDAAVALGDIKDPAGISAAGIVEAREITSAAARYADTLKITGLTLHIAGDGMGLTMDNPVLYIEAIAEVPLPSSETPGAVREHFVTQTDYIVNDALERTARTMQLQGNAGPEDIVAICGEEARELPRVSSLEWELSRGRTPSSEEKLFALSVVENASELTTALHQQEMPPYIEDPVRQLSLAQKEARIPDWLIGMSLDIIGRGDYQPGTDRLTDATQWKAAYRYLAHLGQTDSQFTHDVQQTFLREIAAALEGDTFANPEVLPKEGQALRAKLQAPGKPVLQRAIENLRQIIPPEA